MSKNRNDRKGIRRADAEARQEAWAQLTPAQQLAELDRRLGKGIGAKKQRARLSKALAKEKVKS